MVATACEPSWFAADGQPQRREIIGARSSRLRAADGTVPAPPHWMTIFSQRENCHPALSSELSGH